MTITYIAVEFFFNIILPLFLVLEFALNGPPKPGDTDEWEITLQLLEDIRCEINLIFVLQMLVFFHKLSNLYTATYYHRASLSPGVNFWKKF